MLSQEPLIAPANDPLSLSLAVRLTGRYGIQTESGSLANVDIVATSLFVDEKFLEYLISRRIQTEP